MAEIIKASSGLLYHEEFKGEISLIWDLSPSDPDRVVINNDSISLLPGDEQVELLIPVPRECGYVFQTSIEYNPTSASERGGCILKSITTNAAELEISGDDSARCSHIKMEVASDYVVTAKAGNGSKWTDYGNTRLIDANKIGFYLGSGTSVDPIKIFNCSMYKANHITFKGLDNMHKLRIFNTNDVELTDKFVIRKFDRMVVIDGTNTLFPINNFRVKIFDSNNQIVYQNDFNDVCGGDNYEFSYNISMTVNDKPMNSDEFDLGVISEHTVYSLKITNNEDYKLENKKLKIEAYNPYNQGYKAVNIARIRAGAIYDDFEKEKVGINIEPHETRDFAMRIAREDQSLLLGESFKFKITFE